MRPKNWGNGTRGWAVGNLASHRDAGVHRTRGDGPEDQCGFNGDSTCAPRMRGWTEKTAAHDALLDVCPVHAGMDRGITSIRCRKSVPRTRGDGPLGNGMG